MTALPALAAAAALHVATFRADVTPALGEPNIWVTPATRIEDPLWAKGVILESGGERYVVCAIDWCGVGGATHLRFRQAMARAARTDVDKVVLQSVHQHTAPYVVEDAFALLPDFTSPPLRMSTRFLDELSDRLSQAARAAMGRFQEFDQTGVSQARVERVASARRIVGSSGELITRYSTSGKDPRMAALPEGDIDSWLRTVTLARGATPIVRLHFYATHPQTFCCDGRVSSDIAGLAREAFEKEENIFQIYFTGCAGDVTVGKYNDESAEARAALSQRLHNALAASSRDARFKPAASLAWRSVPLTLPRKPRLPIPAVAAPQDRYRAAIHAVFADRRAPLATAALDLGQATLIFLPGEPMLEFQRYAADRAGARFVAVAGYGDIAPGYLCTDEAFRQGGYEPGASGAAPGTGAAVKSAILKLIGR